MSTGEMMWHVPWKNAITLLRAIPTVAFQCIYFWHILTYIWWHSIWIYLTYYLTFYEILCGIFAIEAPQCPLTSGSCRWGLAGPLGSGSRCWARRWGPTVPTDIWRLRLRPGSAHWDLERLRSEAGGGRRRQAAPLIKSRDPHLACMAMHNAKKSSSTNQTEAYIIPYYTQYWLTYGGFWNGGTHGYPKSSKIRLD